MTKILIGKEAEIEEFVPVGTIDNVLPIGSNSDVVKIIPFLNIEKYTMTIGANLNPALHSNLVLTSSNPANTLETIKTTNIIDGTILLILLLGGCIVKHNITPATDYAPIMLNGGNDLTISNVGTLMLLYNHDEDKFFEISQMNY